MCERWGLAVHEGEISGDLTAPLPPTSEPSPDPPSHKGVCDTQRVTSRVERGLTMKRASLCLVAVAALASPAWGQVTITCLEVGPDVVCTSPGGPISLAGLTFSVGPIAVTPIMVPTGPPAVQIGASAPADFYSGATAPPAFGPGAVSIPSSASGPILGASSGLFSIRVPTGHVSGATVGASSMTFSTKTFATLGIIPGTYVWTWASGSITLQIGPVPVPAASPVGLALLMLVALVLLAAFVGRRTSLEVGG